VDENVAAAKAATKRIVWLRETVEEAAAAAGTPAVPVAGDASVEAMYSGRLKAAEIQIGDSDYRFTHVLSGSLKDGDEVVTGIKPPEAP